MIRGKIKRLTAMEEELTLRIDILARAHMEIFNKGFDYSVIFLYNCKCL